MRPSRGRVVDEKTLVSEVQRARTAGRRVVLTNGALDTLNVGPSAPEGRPLGDALAVAVNDDVAVRAAKGVGSARDPAAERAEVVGVAGVDFVHVFRGRTVGRLLECCARTSREGPRYDLDTLRARDRREAGRRDGVRRRRQDARHHRDPRRAAAARGARRRATSKAILGYAGSSSPARRELRAAGCLDFRDPWATGAPPRDVVRRDGREVRRRRRRHDRLREGRARGVAPRSLRGDGRSPDGRTFASRRGCARPSRGSRSRKDRGPARGGVVAARPRGRRSTCSSRHAFRPPGRARRVARAGRLPPGAPHGALLHPDLHAATFVDGDPRAARFDHADRPARASREEASAPTTRRPGFSRADAAPVDDAALSPRDPARVLGRHVPRGAHVAARDREADRPCRGAVDVQGRVSPAPGGGARAVKPDGRLEGDPAALAALAADGVTTVANVLARAECVRDLARRSNHVLRAGGLVVHVKRTKSRRPSAEAAAIRVSAAAGVPVPRIAFEGVDAKQGSVAGTVDLAPARPLDDLWPRARSLATDAAFECRASGGGAPRRAAPPPRPLPQPRGPTTHPESVTLIDLERLSRGHGVPGCTVVRTRRDRGPVPRARPAPSRPLPGLPRRPRFCPASSTAAARRQEGRLDSPPRARRGGREAVPVGSAR